MTINEIIEENFELKKQYARAIETIARLQNKINKLEREIEYLKRDNEKLRKQRDTLLRGIKIALEISDKEKQDLHLRKIVEKLKEELGDQR
ncbi:hypothetical protein [Acidianus sp. HS-5]|uniref:hypothetical protein n=1 Tax=Acidianus sp. HS-5 TaxID=2886040 RepID=UPI001F27CCB4|nr:hypothetical protein [Acidianus sp. HS-5]BDC18205.1 hypothetical protein HS5_10950 [Acidianus sp. HS-5]